MNKKNDMKTCLLEPVVEAVPVVEVGSVVTLLSEITDYDFGPEKWKLRIISNREYLSYDDPEIDYCTANSPLALAILGLTVGQSGEYTTDNGFAYRVKILEIENPKV